MEEPDDEAVEEPIRSQEDAKKEGAWMVKQWTGLATISIFLLLLVILAFMQATELVDLLAPLANTQIEQWIAFALLAFVVVAVFLWSRRGV